MNSRVPKTVFLFLAIAVGIYFLLYYPLLPDLVASHFNARGVANGWQSKPVFFGFFAGACLIGIFLAFGIPWLIERLSIELVNLPNKRYWFGPEHLKTTNEFLATWFGWFGCATFIVILLTFHYAVQSNLHPEDRPAPSAIVLPLLAFGAFSLVAVVSILVRFSKVPPGEN